MVGDADRMLQERPKADAATQPNDATTLVRQEVALAKVELRETAKQLGRERPTEVVIIDGLDPKWVTVMRHSDFAWRDVPDAWLQRDYLPRFKPE